MADCKGLEERRVIDDGVCSSIIGCGVDWMSSGDRIMSDGEAIGVGSNDRVIWGDNTVESTEDTGDWTVMLLRGSF